MIVTITLDIPNGIYHYQKTLLDDESAVFNFEYQQEILDYINAKYIEKLTRSSCLTLFKDLEPRANYEMTSTLTMNTLSSTISVLLDLPLPVMNNNIFATFLGYTNQVQWDVYLDKMFTIFRLLSQPV